MGKLVKRIPGLCLLISSLPDSALRTHVESLGKPCDVNKRSLVNLISKDTNVVFSIYDSIIAGMHYDIASGIQTHFSMVFKNELTACIMSRPKSASKFIKEIGNLCSVVHKYNVM